MENDLDHQLARLQALVGPIVARSGDRAAIRGFNDVLRYFKAGLPVMARATMDSAPERKSAGAIAGEFEEAARRAGARARGEEPPEADASAEQLRLRTQDAASSRSDDEFWGRCIGRRFLGKTIVK